MPSRKTAAAQGRVLARLKVKLDDGRESTLFELPWKACTPLVGSFYRAARTLEKNGRKDRDGSPAHVTDSTVNRELTTLQSMFTYHRDVRGSISHNPLDGFHHTDERGRARQTMLTPEQVDSFLECAHPLFNDICRVAYRCAGMRRGEAQMLRKSEIDWAARVINLPAPRNKNRRPRPIPFPDDVERILRRHADVSRGPYVFVSPRDPKRIKPVTDSAMWYWLNQARKRSGMVGFDSEPIVVHTLRHSGVTALVEQGAKESFIMAAAGMTPKTFSRYVKFGRQQQDDLRKVMNRSVTPPTPITTELEGERRPANSSVTTPRLVSKPDTQG